jgi:hypothetical protein
MLMLDEKTVVLDGVAEGADLVSDLCLVAKGSVDGQVTIILSEVKELNWARVAVVVHIPPVTLNCLHSLEDLSVEVDFF